MYLDIQSKMSKGEKLVWLKKAGYIKFRQDMDGLNKPEADLEWAKELERLPPSCISSDRSEILYPIDRFVVFTDAETLERLRL